MTREEFELLTDILYFTTLFYVTLRRVSSEWIESSVKSDLGMRFAIWSLGLSLSGFLLSSNTFSKRRSF